ncbi:MAG: MotA/TolQ/ExbB proton channel family protein, partial [Longimicrobiales bacterium]|nr:MotA/TolQ/ExbB proton channel family protein [Longimicrobiales bacterium]
MAGLMKLYGSLVQIPGMEMQELTMQENMAFIWAETGIMRWPLALCVLIGVVYIIMILAKLMIAGSQTKKILVEVEALLAENRFDEAQEACAASNSPAARILHAGLERADEGSERVGKAIENEGLLQLSKLEKGLVVLATLTNVAPLLGFLGTVIGMIIAFQSIEAAGEVEATLV